MRYVITIIFCCCFHAFAQKYQLVNEGSKCHFEIKNFGINIGGDIAGLSGTVILNPQLLGYAAINVTLQVATIDTDNKSRDQHLRKEDYFDVKQYPTMQLISTQIVATTQQNNYILKGTITIKNKTEPVEFPFVVTPKNGGILLNGGFTINRLTFGVGGSSAVLSNKVKISINAFAKAL